MRRLFYILVIMTVVPFGKMEAQQGFSFGLGGGPNYFFGSIIEAKNIGLTGSFDTRYNFNSKVSTTLSYSFNKLQASQLTGGKTAYYFNTTANNVDLHLGFNVLQLSQAVDENFPLRFTIDLGFGMSFYDESLYYGDAAKLPKKEGDLHYGYQAEHGPGSSAKFHVGGEIAYSINDSYAIYTNILGHHYFTSEVDGKSHYINDATKPTYNDNYFSLAVGARYYLNTTGERGRSRSSSPRRSSTGFFQSNPFADIFQNFRFDRYLGKKSPKQSVKSNSAKQPRSSGQRYQGQKTKKKIPTSSSSRYEGRKTNGGIPK